VTKHNRYAITRRVQRARECLMLHRPRSRVDPDAYDVATLLVDLLLWCRDNDQDWPLHEAYEQYQDIVLTTKVYIACSLLERDRAKSLRSMLQEAGYEVTSSWIDCEPPPAEGRKPEECNEIARRNQADMDRADVIVALLSPQVRGTLVEIGYGVGREKRVLVASGNYPGPTLMCDLGGVEWTGPENEVILNALERRPSNRP